MAAEPAVLLLGRSADAEFTGLARRLAAAGVAVRRVLAEEADADPLSIDLASGTLSCQGLRGFRPTVTWLRHFTGRASAGQPAGAAQRLFHNDSWAALARQLSAVCPTVIGEVAPGLLAQLSAARAEGVRVPRTIVATEPRAAARLAASRYVIKALDCHVVEAAPGQLAWFHPRITGPAGLAELVGFPAAPVIVQEFVRHDAELRLYLAGRELHCFGVVKERPEDIWARPRDVQVRYLATPPALARAAAGIARRLGLVFGAFDFLMDGAVPVFLEVNHQGDWRWFERKSGADPVSQAAARLVLARHRDAGASSRPHGFNLLSFVGAARPGARPQPGREQDP